MQCQRDWITDETETQVRRHYGARASYCCTAERKNNEYLHKNLQIKGKETRPVIDTYQCS